MFTPTPRCECAQPGLIDRVRNKRYRIAISDAIKFNSDVSPMAHRKVATQNFALQFHSNFT